MTKIPLVPQTNSMKKSLELNDNKFYIFMYRIELKLIYIFISNLLDIHGVGLLVSGNHLQYIILRNTSNVLLKDDVRLGVAFFLPIDGTFGYLVAFWICYAYAILPIHQADVAKRLMANLPNFTTQIERMKIVILAGNESLHPNKVQYTRFHTTKCDPQAYPQQPIWFHQGQNHSGLPGLAFNKIEHDVIIHIKQQKGMEANGVKYIQHEA
ncbi:hypothetical protein ACJX0J_028738, partial [Zea mays]